METVIAVLSDGILLSTTTIVLCLSSKEFRFYNLSAGAWMVLGGWIGAYLEGILTMRSGLPANGPLVFIVGVTAASIYLFLVFLLGGRLSRHPIAFLALSLGFSLVLTSIFPTFLLDSYSSTVPTEYHSTLPTLVISCTISFLIVLTIFKSPFWARLALRFRAQKDSDPIWKDIAKLLALELALLLVLGFAGSSVHKGIFASAEHRTLIPLLALVSGKSNPLRSFAYCFLIVIVGHSIVSILSPAIGFPELGRYAISTTLVILLFLVAVTTRPWNSIIQARGLDETPRRSFIYRDLKSALTNPLTLSFAIVVLIALSVNIIGIINREDYQRILMMLVLVSASWIVQRHFGIYTVAAPAMGVIIVYILAIQELSISISILFFCLVAFWSLYFWYLRTISLDAALVIDLATVTCIHQFVLNSPSITGADNIQMLPDISSTVFRVSAEIFLIGSVGFLFTSAWSLSEIGSMRAISLALSKPILGYFHGIHAKKFFIAFIAIIVLVSMLAGVCSHFVSGYVTPADLSIENGLFILLLAFLMNRTTPVFGVLLVTIIFGGVFSIMSGFGSVLSALVGGVFIISPAFLTRGK